MSATAQTDIRINGSLPDDLNETLRALPRVTTLETNVPAADVIAAARGDYNRILAELYDAGYFAAAISITLAGIEASAISPFDRPNSVRPIVVRIDPGRPFRFGVAQIAPLPQDATLPESFAPGQTASTGAIRDAAEASIDAWRAASHAKAQISGQSITARHTGAILDATVSVNPGPALRFGTLSLPSNSAVRPRALARIAGFPQTEAFQPDQVLKVRNRLLDTGAFRSVVLTQSATPNADDTLDYTLSVEDALPRRIGGGAELSSTDGLTLEAFWMHRNAFGRAERFTADIAVEGLAQPQHPDVLGELSLSIPGFRRPDDTLTFSLEAANRFEPTFESMLFSFGFIRQRDIGQGRTIGAGADFRFARVKDAFGTRDMFHFAPIVQGTWDERDDRLSATAGYYADVTIRPFIGLNDDADDGIQAVADLRAYYPISDRSVLAGRLQLGQILNASRVGTPAEWLFTSGGGGTVRGLPYNSLGVADDNGDVTGGRGFLGLSTELRQDITDTIGVVGFVDLGVVSESNDFSNYAWHAGAGVGARYKTPLGPIRVDLALPIEGGSSGDFGLYIGIGQAF